MHKRIDFDNLGGNPIDQQSLEFMQSSYREALAAIAKLVGDKVILSGVDVVGGNVTDGFITYNGEVVRFIGGVAGADVVVSEAASHSPAFQDTVVHDVELEKTASIGSGAGSFPFADLKDIGTILSIKEALDALTAAYNAHNHSYEDLDDKPAAKIVHMDSAPMGDISASDSFITVNIPDQGGTNYHVLGSMRGNSGSATLDNDISWTVYDKQVDSFKVAIREYAAVAQSLTFDYVIVKA